VLSKVTPVDLAIQKVHPFVKKDFDKAVQTSEDTIDGTGQTIHWSKCDRAFQRKCGGGAWFGMNKDGGSVTLLPGYSAYFQRGASGEVRIEA
ncbi:hypothetical protein LB507_004255, partial [Fusarium sp. FIESC RH6]